MAYELGWDVIAAARLTARLRASEERLRESEQRLQMAAGAGELGLWEWNVAVDDVWMTPECRALFGYRADEPVGLSRFLESVHPDDRAAVERGVRASLSDGGHDFERGLSHRAAGRTGAVGDLARPDRARRDRRRRPHARRHP